MYRHEEPWLDCRELSSELEALQACRQELDEEELERLSILEQLDGEIDMTGRAMDGCVLIPEVSFEDYAREFAEGIGAIDSDARWPATCIDWEQAASELAMDFNSITFNGTDYLYR